MRKTDFGNKPFGTKIQLTKSGEFFEAYIPPFGFHFSILFIAPFAIFWNGGIAVWTLMASQIPFPINIFFMLFSLPFWAAGGFLAYTCLFILFGKTYFRIDRHEISLTKTLFGLKVSRQTPLPKRQITQIVFTQQHSEAEGAAALKFEAGTQSIAIGGAGGGIQHEAEVEWLAYETSEWLDKPLIIIEARSR
jgi:hypothetical protein